MSSRRPQSNRLVRAALAACALLCCLGLALPARGVAATRGLLTGFTDFDAFQNADAPDRDIAFQHARGAGASIVRFTWSWAAAAPNAPAKLSDTRDPAWSGYDWGFVDSVTRQAVAAGLNPLFEVTGAPRWAEGPKRPPVSSRFPAGSWKPSPSAFEAFAEAAARRYSGHYPDPQNPGHFLPRIRYWQGWNEPNLTTYLSPQWARSHGRLVPASPNIYRQLLNAWYRGIKKVLRSNVVVTAGTAPFGDLHKGDPRMPPALFVRDLFCLSGRHALRRVHCKGAPVHFDVLAHHPYPIGPPRRHAPNPDDVSIADWSRLTKPLHAAQKHHTVTRGHKQLWATEFSWNSKPQDPLGIPQQLEATYVQGALSELWQEGVTVATWFNMRDAPADGNALPSGIFFRADTISDDKPKPAYTAFSFPFTAYVHRARAQLWGLAPARGLVAIEKRSGSGWTTIARLHARSRDRMFLGHARLSAGTLVRAQQGTSTSVPWKVFSP